MFPFLIQPAFFLILIRLPHWFYEQEENNRSIGLYSPGSLKIKNKRIYNKNLKAREKVHLKKQSNGDISKSNITSVSNRVTPRNEFREKQWNIQGNSIVINYLKKM